MSDFVTAGDIAEATGLTRQGVHFYEERGLIKPTLVTKVAKLYDKNVIKRVKRIQKLKETYRLDAIRTLLDKEGK